MEDGEPGARLSDLAHQILGVAERQCMSNLEDHGGHRHVEGGRGELLAHAPRSVKSVATVVREATPSFSSATSDSLISKVVG